MQLTWTGHSSVAVSLRTALNHVEDMCPEKMAEALELVVQQHHVLRDLQQSFLETASALKGAAALVCASGFCMFCPQLQLYLHASASTLLFQVFLPGRQEVHALADRLTAVTSMQVQRLFGGQATRKRSSSQYHA